MEIPEYKEFDSTNGDCPKLSQTFERNFQISTEHQHTFPKYIS